MLKEDGRGDFPRLVTQCYRIPQGTRRMCQRTGLVNPGGHNYHYPQGTWPGPGARKGQRSASLSIGSKQRRPSGGPCAPNLPCPSLCGTSPGPSALRTGAPCPASRRQNLAVFALRTGSGRSSGASAPCARAGPRACRRAPRASSPRPQELGLLGRERPEHCAHRTLRDGPHRAKTRGWLSIHSLGSQAAARWSRGRAPLTPCHNAVTR